MYGISAPAPPPSPISRRWSASSSYSAIRPCTTGMSLSLAASSTARAVSSRPSPVREPARANRAPRSHRVAMRVHAGLGVAERIGRAGHGHRVAGAVRNPHRDIVVCRRPAFGSNSSMRGSTISSASANAAYGSPAIWALRGPTSISLPPACAHQAAAGDADHAHVDRADIGLVAADAGIGHGRPAVADHADIGRCAADFEVEAVGDAQVHERARDAGRRARQHRHRPAAAAFHRCS